jgi:hypothetical protein
MADDMTSRQHPHTSSAAAGRVQPHLSRLQELVYKYIQEYGPVSDEHIWDAFSKLGESTARKRRTELVQKGLVESCGTTTNTRGNRMLLWRVVGAEPEYQPDPQRRLFGDELVAQLQK